MDFRGFALAVLALFAAASPACVSDLGALASGRWGDRLFLVTADAKLETRDVQTGERTGRVLELATKTYQARHKTGPASFSGDGKHLALTFDPDRLRCYATASGLVRWETRLPSIATAVAFDDEAGRVLVATEDRRLLVFDGNDGRWLTQMPIEKKVYGIRALGAGAYELRLAPPGAVEFAVAAGIP